MSSSLWSIANAGVDAPDFFDPVELVPLALATEGPARFPGVEGEPPGFFR